MTDHDRIRCDEGLRVLSCKYNSREVELVELAYAIRGLQSTDEPILNGLHDVLMERWMSLERGGES